MAACGGVCSALNFSAISNLCGHPCAKRTLVHVTCSKNTRLLMRFPHANTPKTVRPRSPFAKHMVPSPCFLSLRHSPLYSLPSAPWRTPLLRPRHAQRVKRDQIVIWVIERSLSSAFSSQQQPGPHSPLKPPPAPCVQTSAKPLHHPKPRSPPPPPLWAAQPATNPCILSSTKSPSYMEPSGQMNVPWRVEERRCETVNGWRAKGDDVLFASCASIGIG